MRPLARQLGALAPRSWPQPAETAIRGPCCQYYVPMWVAGGGTVARAAGSCARTATAPRPRVRGCCAVFLGPSAALAGWQGGSQLSNKGFSSAKTHACSWRGARPGSMAVLTIRQCRRRWHGRTLHGGSGRLAWWQGFTPWSPPGRLYAMWLNNRRAQWYQAAWQGAGEGCCSLAVQ